jgi:hypothetical protein
MFIKCRENTPGELYWQFAVFVYEERAWERGCICTSASVALALRASVYFCPHKWTYFINMQINTRVIIHANLLIKSC